MLKEHPPRKPRTNLRLVKDQGTGAGTPQPPGPPPPPSLEFRVQQLENRLFTLLGKLDEDRDLVAKLLDDLGDETKRNSDLLDRIVKWILTQHGGPPGSTPPSQAPLQ